MGVLEKIKNALFEVEYVEVDEEKEKKEKKHSSKEKTDEQVETEKPIAKKIVLPGKKEEKVQEIQEEELKDEDFEIRPKDEKVKEVFQDNFNVMDDDPPIDAPKEEFIEPVEPVVENNSIDIAPLVEQTTVPPTTISPVYQENVYADKDYVREYDSYKEKVYNTIHEDYHVKARESKPYGLDPSYQISIKEYGGENRDEKGVFKSSPIISPVYGILDKNYHKEDVVTKKEIHLTSSYSKAHMNVDDIRDKAYGKKEEIPMVEESPKTRPPFLEPVENDENLLVDLTDEKKPEVKEITMGDAMEYYHDLGLEYNVDYVDASSKAPQPTDDLEEDIKDTIDSAAPAVLEPIIEKTIDIPVKEIASEPVEEKKEEVSKEKSTKESTIDDDDNLFDLIDSMYKEEDN